MDQYFCTLTYILCFEIEELWQVSLALSWMSECEELRSRWETSSWQLQCRNEINILQCVLAYGGAAGGGRNVQYHPGNTQSRAGNTPFVLSTEFRTILFYQVKSIYLQFICWAKENTPAKTFIYVFFPFHFSNCTTFTHYPSESTHLVDLNVKI